MTQQYYEVYGHAQPIKHLEACSLGPGFPGSSDGKEQGCNSEDPGSISGLGTFPGKGNGYPLEYSCLENPKDRGAWWAKSMRSQRVAK